MSTANEFQQISPDIFFWEVYEPQVKADLSCVAVRSAEGLVFVDPIRLAGGALFDITEAYPPTAIVLTNGNHQRASAWYARKFGIPVLAHPAALPELEPDLEVQGTLREGALVGGDLRVLEVTGAGAGEIALLSPRGSLHTGDALIHAEPYGFCVLPPKYCLEPKKLKPALQKLLQEPWRILTFSHGLPITAQAQQRLAALLA